MTDRLPPDIEALIAAERATPDPSAGVMQSVRAQVARSVGAAPLGHAVGNIATKLVMLAVLVGAGALGYLMLRSRGVEASALAWVHQVEPTPELVADEVTVTERERQPRVEPGAPKPAVQSRRVEPAVEARRVEPAPPSRVDVARMLTSAWQQLSNGDAASAIGLVEQVAAMNPHGPLEEERHALEVAALLALDRDEEARSSAQRFVEQYPHSIHARLVGRALGR